jgi:beta-lactamase class A
MVLRPELLVSLVILWGSGSWEEAWEGKPEVKTALRRLFPYFAPQPPPGLADHFSPDFQRSIPVAHLGRTFQAIQENQGRPEQLHLRRMNAPYAGEVEIYLSKGSRIPVEIALETQPPHRIRHLVFKPIETVNDSWTAVAADLAKIPGRVACTVLPLETNQKPLLAYNGEEPLAVGSSFKLILLTTLAEEIAAQRMSWQEIVRTDKRHYSLPGGLLQDWPANSPVTLHTLATLMISRSDNTAADHLLRHLGQARVLALQQRLFSGKNTDSTRNEPFLSTAELFKIKMKLSPEQQQQFAQAAPEERKKLLATLVQPQTLDQPRLLSRPVHIDRIEWFYSTAELCRVMDQLRRSENVPGLKEMLAITQPFEVDEQVWPYVGFKGGSEAGVLNFTLLLRHRQGKWYALSITWNHPEQVKEEGHLRELVERIIRLLGRAG